MRFCRGHLYCYLLILIGSETFAQQGFGYRPNPNAYWHFLTPSGYGPPAGKAIVEDGLFAFLQYQKTTPNGNTISFGMVPTLLWGEKYMPIWLGAHRRIPIGGTKRQPAAVANIGGFFLSLPPGAEGTEKDRDFSLFYSNFTFGSREKNFSLGAAIAPTGLGDGIHPQAITVHGMTRLGRRSCLVTENYIIHDRGVWIPCTMNGWRVWRNRTAIDVAVLLARVPAGSSLSNKRFWVPIPWLAVHHTLQFDFINWGDE